MSSTSLDPVTRYHVALAKHRRQLNRFFSGPVGSWQSPYSVGGDGTLAGDSKLTLSRSELDASIVAMSDTQRERHVLNLTAEQIKGRDYSRAVKAARGVA